MLCPGGACIDDGGCTNGMVSQRRACRHFVGEMWCLRSGLKDGDWRLENLRQSSPELASRATILNYLEKGGCYRCRYLSGGLLLD